MTSALAGEVSSTQRSATEGAALAGLFVELRERAWNDGLALHDAIIDAERERTFRRIEVEAMKQIALIAHADGASPTSARDGRARRLEIAPA
jgi:hypothetical protein